MYLMHRSILLTEVAELIGEFRRGQTDAGISPQPDDAVFAFHTHVADSDAEAERVAAKPFDLYVDTRLYAKKQTYADILRSGLGLLGSVEHVADKLIALRDMGLGHVMLLQNFGLMPVAEVERSMRMIMNDVMPRVNAQPTQAAIKKGQTDHAII